MAQKLKNKIAIVTGGNSGIGEATAKLFAQEGAKVIIMARRDEEGKRVENEIKDNGGVANFIKCDVGDEKTVNSALNSTLSRTLNTSFTTLVVLLAMFVFGADSLRGLLFALIVGVLVGTYSSVFVATPIMKDTLKKYTS